MPVCILGYTATCPLYSVDHIFVYVVHNCRSQSRLIVGLYRDHHWSSIDIPDHNHPDRLSSFRLWLIQVVDHHPDRPLPSLIAIVLITTILQIVITTDHRSHLIVNHPDRRSSFRSRSLPIVDHTWSSTTLIVAHPSDHDHTRLSITIPDNCHTWSPVVSPILITLCVADIDILTIVLGILTIDLGILTIGLGILKIDLGIVTIDLGVAQQNSQSILLNDL